MRSIGTSDNYRVFFFFLFGDLSYIAGILILRSIEDNSMCVSLGLQNQGVQREHACTRAITRNRQNITRCHKREMYIY